MCPSNMRFREFVVSRAVEVDRRFSRRVRSVAARFRMRRTTLHPRVNYGTSYLNMGVRGWNSIVCSARVLMLLTVLEAPSSVLAVGTVFVR